MKKIKYTLGNTNFSTKVEIKTMYRGILDSYEKNTIPTSEDQYHILNLFKWHPNYVEKSGVGIKRFEVRIGPPYEFQQKCFYVIRTDDTYDDFSYTGCINNIKKIEFAV